MAAVMTKETKSGCETEMPPSMTEPDGEEDLVLRQRVEHALDEHALQDEPEQEHDRDDDDDGEKRVDPEQREDVVGEVHPHHEQLAVREVDDAHDAEDEGEADADEGVDATHQHPAHDGLKEDLQGCLPPNDKRAPAGLPRAPSRTTDRRVDLEDVLRGHHGLVTVKARVEGREDARRVGGLRGRVGVRAFQAELQGLGGGPDDTGRSDGVARTNALVVPGDEEVLREGELDAVTAGELDALDGGDDALGPEALRPLVPDVRQGSRGRGGVHAALAQVPEVHVGVVPEEALAAHLDERELEDGIDSADERVEVDGLAVRRERLRCSGDGGADRAEEVALLVVTARDADLARGHLRLELARDASLELGDAGAVA